MRDAATQAMSDIVEDPELRSGRAPLPRSGTARWLCCPLLTYRPGYSSSLAPRQRAWGPAAKCEVISARALRDARRESSQKFAPNFTNSTKEIRGIRGRTFGVDATGCTFDNISLLSESRHCTISRRGGP